MRGMLVLAAACGLGVCGAGPFSVGPADAAPVNAADPLALFDVELLDGTDLSNASGVRLSTGVTTSQGAGDFRVVPSGTGVTTGGALDFHTPLGGVGIQAFSFTLSGFGTFTETAAPQVINQGVTASSTSIEAYLPGVFSPAGGLAGFTPGPASFDVSFTRSASATNGAVVASTSGSGTLASPPAAVAGAASPRPWRCWGWASRRWGWRGGAARRGGGERDRGLRRPPPVTRGAVGCNAARS